MLLLGIDLSLSLGWAAVDLDRLIVECRGRLSLYWGRLCYWCRCGHRCRSWLLAHWCGWCSLTRRLLIGVNNETCLSGCVLNYALFTVGINISVSSLNSSVIQSGFLAETLSSRATSGIVAKLVVALEGWTDFDVVQLGLMRHLLGCSALVSWSSYSLTDELTGRAVQLLSPWCRRCAGAGH